MSERFTGKPASSHPEAKGKTVHDLDATTGNYVLAKDVIAFANAGGATF